MHQRVAMLSSRKNGKTEVRKYARTHARTYASKEARKSRSIVEVWEDWTDGQARATDRREETHAF